jgi:hypothetical protein
MRGELLLRYVGALMALCLSTVTLPVPFLVSKMYENVTGEKGK